MIKGTYVCSTGYTTHYRHLYDKDGLCHRCGYVKGSHAGLIDRKCMYCKKIKPISDFYFNKSWGYYKYECKKCTNATTPYKKNYRREYFKANADYLRKYYKKHRQKPEVKKRIYENNKIINKTVEGKARRILIHAVADGRVIKPKECSVCGKVVVLHGHHKDYSKPLKVRWVCPRCHTDIHIQIREANLIRGQE